MSIDKETFNRDPRSYALEMVEDGMVTYQHMLCVILNYMSTDDVRKALDANELSPRFTEEEEGEEES